MIIYIYIYFIFLNIFFNLYHISNIYIYNLQNPIYSDIIIFINFNVQYDYIIFLCLDMIYSYIFYVDGSSWSR